MGWFCELLRDDTWTEAPLNHNQEIWRELGLYFLARVTSVAQNYQYPVVWQVQASLLPAVLLFRGSWVLGWGLGQLLVFLSSDEGFLFPLCFMDALVLLRSCLMCSTLPCSPSTQPTLLAWEVLTEQSMVRRCLWAVREFNFTWLILGINATGCEGEWSSVHLTGRSQRSKRDFCS